MSDVRNIVLITLDSVRADHCSFMGYCRKTTPTIDRMARKGLYFENAIAASVPTGPSMFSCFTSEFLYTSKILEPKIVRNFFLQSKTLAEVLSNSGYETVAVHRHPWLSRIFGFDKGFRYYSCGDFDRVKSRNAIKWITDVLKGIGASTPWHEYYDEIIKKIKTLREPWFLWTILLDTHTPYFPPIKKWNKNRATLIYHYAKLKFLKSKYPRKIKSIIDAYDDAIFYADIFIKNLLEDLGSYDPIFIIHADHGDGFGEHGFYHHPPQLYEELIHVPLVIYNSDLKGKIDYPVSLRSLSPTIIKLAGIENTFSAKTLLDKTEWAISQVFDNYRRIAIRLKRWKYIWSETGEELYNLKDDPHEQINVVNEHRDLAMELKNIVKNFVNEEKSKIIKNTIKRIRRL